MPPAGAVEPEPHDVDAADAGAGVEAAPLRQVADPVVRVARAAGRAPTRARRPSGSRPRTALISVDLPAPFGPRTATNSPRPTVRSRRRSRSSGRRGAPPRRRTRPPAAASQPRGRRAAAAARVAHRPVALASAARSALELARLPVLEAGAAAGSGVSVIGRDRDARCLRAASVSRWTSGVRSGCCRPRP